MVSLFHLFGILGMNYANAGAVDFGDSTLEAESLGATRDISESGLAEQTMAEATPGVLPVDLIKGSGSSDVGSSANATSSGENRPGTNVSGEYFGRTNIAAPRQDHPWFKDNKGSAKGKGNWFSFSSMA